MLAGAIGLCIGIAFTVAEIRSMFDDKWLREYQQRTGCRVREYGRETAPEEPKQRKYRNTPTELDGIRFDSKHEAEVYAELKMRQKAGDIAALSRQVRFRLSDRIEYVADFVVIDRDGTHIMDAKSEITRRDKVYIIKKKLMLEKWGVVIEEV